MQGAALGGKKRHPCSYVGVPYRERVTLYTVEPPIKDTIEKKPLYKGHTLRSQNFTFLVHFNLRREDNLSIKDKMPGSIVSIIWRRALVLIHMQATQERGRVPFPVVSCQMTELILSPAPRNALARNTISLVWKIV